MDPEVVYTADDLHDESRAPRGGQAQDICDNPASFHPSNDVCADHASTRHAVREEFFADTPFLAFGFFLRVLGQDAGRFIALKPGILGEHRVEGRGNLGLIGGFFCRVFCRARSKRSRKWQPCMDVAGQEVVQIRLAKKDCQSCPVRAACTRAKTAPRTITVRMQAYYEALQAARHDQTTVAFKAHYAMWAGIESPLSQGVRAFDLRRSRYRDLAQTHLQNLLIAVGINLKRAMAWLTHLQPTKPYISPFAALVASG